ncbi:hypothetical protein GCM10027049_11840 [Mucilaginibacter puniceus]
MKGYKKFRGLKRYYLNLPTENDLDKIDFFDFAKPESWPKDWHIHFDWYGFGNNNFKKRKPHLDKLFRHFDMISEKTKDSNSRDFQLYAILLDNDSAHDALFFHTPNVNNDQFQFKVSDLQLTSTLKNKPLNDYIDNLAGYEKLYGQADEAFCLIFKKNIGQSF